MVGPLDVNVLVALSWPEHEAFARSHRWFARHAAAGWATCPITQAGFVRVVSNPAFSMLTITPREALAQPGHHNEALQTSFLAGRHFVGAGYRTVCGSYGRPSADHRRLPAWVGDSPQGEARHVRPRDIKSAPRQHLQLPS